MSATHTACPSCGADVTADAAFCSRCGARQETQVGQAAAAAAPAGVASTSAGDVAGPSPYSPPPPVSTVPQAPEWVPVASPVGGSEAPKVGDGYAWRLALAPVLMSVLEWRAYTQGWSLAAQNWLLFAFVLAVSVNAGIDAYKLRKAGHDVSMFLAVLLYPAYLFQRRRLSSNGHAIFWSWVAAFGASLAFWATLGQGVVLPSAEVERYLKSQVVKESDVQNVTVDCPDTLGTLGFVRSGDAFTCYAELGRQDVWTIDVDVTGNDGSYWWTVR